ncbi:MAG TPA: hypothetical protein PLU22_22135, partial [Polyangiaceae bacterium]|nr:hypothetical protein [Polyangiaceae bacterium]
AGAAGTGGSGAVGTGGNGGDGTGGAGAVGTGGTATYTEQTVPFQEWSGPGASVTGVLFAYYSEAYGAALAWSRDPASGTPPVPYWFSSEGSSPYALYFPSSGEGINYLEDWTVSLASGAAVTYDAAMFTPETPNPWGLAADAHIVTLEVNDGRGSNGGLHFVATDVTVLDGTAAVPMDVVEVMASAAQDFDARVASLDAELTVALAQARDATAPPEDVEFTGSESQGVWPTWYPEPSTLALTFVHRRLENWGEMTGVVETPGMPPPYPEIWDYHYYGAEYVVRYVFAASGTALDTTEYGPAAFGE